MFYYKYKNNFLISKLQYSLPPAAKEELMLDDGVLFVLNKIDSKLSRRRFIITDSSFIFSKYEGIHLLKKSPCEPQDISDFLDLKIREHKLISLNTDYEDWQEAMEENALLSRKWHINLIGLGDVGGIAATGLRLLGSNCIDKIGIYDIDDTKVQRWVNEINQILGTEENVEYPEVIGIDETELFNCDMFIFCVSAGVPEVGREISDVRMAQFERNSKIIESYAKIARRNNFKGIFAVVSDPVDLLCKSAYISSNTNEKGEFDLKGLRPDQIRGYGLGVMNARARFFADQTSDIRHYKKEGRAFGPHGEGLVIADSIINYNENYSDYLTQKTLKANLDVRALGYKPYIAPALSSGALSLIATMEGRWHYSSTFLGGVFMGVRNRLTPYGTEIESIDMCDSLYAKLSNTYNKLHQML